MKVPFLKLFRYLFKCRPYSITNACASCLYGSPGFIKMYITFIAVLLLHDTIISWYTRKPPESLLIPSNYYDCQLIVSPNSLTTFRMIGLGMKTFVYGTLIVGFMADIPSLLTPHLLLELCNIVLFTAYILLSIWKRKVSLCQMRTFAFMCHNYIQLLCYLYRSIRPCELA